MTEQQAHSPSTARAGVAVMTLAFLMWGLLPIYWKLLQGVDALDITAHRVVWSLAFTGALLGIGGRWREVARAMATKRAVARLLLGAALLGTNWLIYVWAINENRILDTSLGYFINPLVNVLLGCLLLKERLRRWQVVSLALAAAAVTVRVIAHGQLPWVALALAGTFGLYGLHRKTSRSESLPGLTAETVVLILPALGFLAYLFADGRGVVGHCEWPVYLLLVGGGVVTALPLLLFAYGARRIRLSTVGFLQYLAPSCTFLLGVFIYREPFDALHLGTFALIWVALAIYSVDSLRSRPRAA